jgi:hypothetical protein
MQRITEIKSGLLLSIPTNFFARAIVCLSVLGTIGCTKKVEDERVFGPVNVEGLSVSSVASPIFKNAVESSIVENNSREMYFIDSGMNGNMTVYEGNNVSNLGSDYRFAYVFKDGSTFYNIVKRPGGMYMFKSSNGYTWETVNNGNPVLSETPGTIYGTVWNVGVTVDQTGTWHMLIECEQNGDNSKAGLGYATAVMNNDGTINFDLNRSATHAVPLAGNPWLGFVPGKGVMAVYGKINSTSKEWFIKGATLQGSSWVEKDNFSVRAPGIHVCDPHVLEINGKLKLSLSYDQYSIYELTSDITYSDLYDLL